MTTQRVQLSLFLCLAMCLGIGILRFSYTALLPSTREAFHWSAQFASILGSANLLGYLLGAFWSMRLPQTRIMCNYIEGAVLAGILSLFCCAFSGMHESWYMLWRTISGISGGLIMILSPSIIAQCAAPQDRFKISFIGFSGIGIGVLLATLFLPYLDQISTRSAWFILTGFAGIAGIGISSLLTQFRPLLQHHSAASAQKTSLDRLFLSLTAVYGCSAFAYIPHSLFWIDYLKQIQHLDLLRINMNWMLYGCGSALGAFSSYWLAKKTSNFTALKILYSAYIFAVLCAVFPYPALTLMSSFLTGLLNPAVVFLTSYTIMQLYGAAYKNLWGLATLTFASVQLLGGLTFSGLQHASLSYPHQFMLASAVLCAGALQLFWYCRNSALQAFPNKEPV